MRERHWSVTGLGGGDGWRCGGWRDAGRAEGEGTTRCRTRAGARDWRCGSLSRCLTVSRAGVRIGEPLGVSRETPPVRGWSGRQAAARGARHGAFHVKHWFLYCGTRRSVTAWVPSRWELPRLRHTLRNGEGAEGVGRRNCFSGLVFHVNRPAPAPTVRASPACGASPGAGHPWASSRTGCAGRREGGGSWKGAGDVFHVKQSAVPQLGSGGSSGVRGPGRPGEVFHVKRALSRTYVRNTRRFTWNAPVLLPLRRRAGTIAR